MFVSSYAYHRLVTELTNRALGQKYVNRSRPFILNELCAVPVRVSSTDESVTTGESFKEGYRLNNEI